jgi:hypothetical protein
VKTFKPKDQKSLPPPDDPGNPTVDFRGEKRSNQTHESKAWARVKCLNPPNDDSGHVPQKNFLFNKFRELNRAIHTQAFRSRAECSTETL